MLRLSEFSIWIRVNFVGFKGDVSGSLAEFDKAIELDPRQKACRFLHLAAMLVV